MIEKCFSCGSNELILDEEDIICWKCLYSRPKNDYNSQRWLNSDGKCEKKAVGK